ncbi:MAG: hypothetical protein RIC18_04265 [Hoeflea sp.]|uniref:hypothetical protein n=1 Tax=Hoeflea sp. TaxID=1940281 RepID=UPI0032ECE1EE
MFRAMFLWFGLAVSLVLLAPVSARAEVLTAIPASAMDDPKAFWRATMEEFYGRYDSRRKCWVAGAGSEPLCMRPHHLAEVVENGTRTFYVAMGGYAVTSEGGRADCHACPGKLGLVILRPKGNRLAVVARNSLAVSAGSWGQVPAEEWFRVVPLGKDNHGWLMEFYYTGQGYTEGGVNVFGAIGDRVVDLGFISTHADNAGTCGDGLGACYTHSYEILADPSGADDRFGDLIARKVESTDPEATGTVRVEFSEDELKYVTPQAVSDALGR